MSILRVPIRLSTPVGERVAAPDGRATRNRTAGERGRGGAGSGFWNSRSDWLSAQSGVSFRLV